MSEQNNPVKLFFSPENVTKLYKTIQIYLKQNHNANIGREYLEQLINVMKLVIKPIKKVPKDVEPKKFIDTLNKRVLTEAIPIFSEVALSHNSPRAMPPRPVATNTQMDVIEGFEQSTPISQIRKGIDTHLPPSTENQQDPRLFNNPDELYDLINQQRLNQEAAKPPEPKFIEPEVQYPDNIDDLYAQAENQRQQTDVLPPPNTSQLQQLPFELKEDFKVLGTPTNYNAQAQGSEARHLSESRFGTTQIPMNSAMSTPISEIRNEGSRNSEFNPNQYKDMFDHPRDNLLNPINSFSEIAPQPQEMRVLIPETSRNLTNDSRIIPIIVGIDSNNKDETENDNSYRIDFDEIRDILVIELMDAQIPITEYIVNESNNVVYFEEVGGITLIAEIPPGNYTATDLAIEIESTMNAVSSVAPGNGVTYTVSADPISEKFTISSGAIGPLIFDLLFFGGTETYGATQPEYRKERAIYLPRSIGEVIGFKTEDNSGSLIYTSQNRWNLNGEPYIWLFLKEAEIVKSRDPHQRKAFAKIVLNNPLGTVKYYSHHIDGQYIKHFSPPIGKLAHFTIEFRKRNGDLYNFNGHTNSLTFRMISKDITQSPY